MRPSGSGGSVLLAIASWDPLGIELAIATSGSMQSGFSTR